MFLIVVFLLQSSFSGLFGAKHETLCTASACFTLHMDQLSFEEAHKKCVHNGGSLITVRNREDEEVVRLLLSKIIGHHQDTIVTFWIGLKLPAGNCVSAHKALRGFRWVSGAEESEYSNWEKEPELTCTADRCVRVNFRLSGQNRLKWITGSCKSLIFYACKFSFRGMCKPLVLKGPGKINYTLPFSEESERSKLKSFPIGTFADVLCNDKQESYSVCQELDQWTVPGPFCSVERQNCRANNGGCQHGCDENGGEPRCFCHEDYELEEDGFSCRIRDLCHADTCEHLCVMSESGYFCKCPHGFKLEENRRNCSDVDECESQACGEHVCKNTHGGYTCVCGDGYKLADGTCSDVNECEQSRCQHSCVNSDGSFSCLCDEGFALSHDGRSCVDIDECASHRCPLQCVNTVGGFTCTSTAPSDEPPDRTEPFTEFSQTTGVEIQHQSPRTHAPSLDPVNVTHGNQRSGASVPSTSAGNFSSKVIVCVLGSVVPLLVLILVTVAIAVFRCSRSKKEAKKNATTDGYCWVSSGLDPRLEKLYESIVTDDP
ncbi:complement component C1q receptor [Betta splendens]|uniref:Complement component C1q receptor n=1 Tax=Betta splendens TaxID=158456 RepID=A0A6P7LKS6_BETSP|nr:complement component C1q receptor [Betta splendens]